jgi:hypothetical protein
MSDTDIAHDEINLIAVAGVKLLDSERAEAAGK